MSYSKENRPLNVVVGDKLSPVEVDLITKFVSSPRKRGWNWKKNPVKKLFQARIIFYQKRKKMI